MPIIINGESVASGLVQKVDFNAGTFMFATADDVPEAKTVAETLAILGVESGADVTDDVNVNSAGATMNTDVDVSGNAWFKDENDMVSDDATKVASQQSIKRYVDTVKRSVAITVTPSDAVVEVADGLYGILIPAEFNGWEIVDVVAGVHTKGVTGATEVQVRRRRAGSDVDVLSTLVTIGDEWYVSDGVINLSNDDLATGDALFIDVDVLHSGTAPYGLFVTVVIQKP